jgi:hypothetical protein
MTVEIVHETVVLFVPDEGVRLSSERDATDLISDAFNARAHLVAVPVHRFDDMFFHLSTRIAGEFLQKFANYRIPLVVVGDISEHTVSSAALRDFVRESNRGDSVWFLADTDALRNRLSTFSPPTRG